MAEPHQTKPGIKKEMLQPNYRTHTKRLEKLRVKLSTAYGMVPRQCTDYLRLKLEIQENWETMPNKRELLTLVRRIKYLAHNYDKDAEFHNVAYHTFLRRFMFF